MKIVNTTGKKIALTSMIAVMGTIGTVALAAKSKDNVNSSKNPSDTFIVEEDFIGPLIYEPFDSLTNFERHYARKEMRAAANELDKVQSWLGYAANRAYPETKDKLNTSISTLKKISTDLKEGRASSAADLRFAVASAKQSLAEWHYFKSKESLAKEDESIAATHLEAAAHYLRNAANDIQYEYPEDTVTWFNSFGGDELGVYSVVIPSSSIASNLDKLEIQIEDMSQALEHLQKS